MARTVLKHKTALILGADCPAGRAVGLQLSREGARVVLGGFDEQKLRLLHELISTKGGDPHQAALGADRDRNETVLRAARDVMGNHYHFILNALALREGPSDDPGRPAREARELADLSWEMNFGRGNLKFLTLWPDEAGDPPPYPQGSWHCLVTARHLEMQHDEVPEAADDAEIVRAAGAADTVTYLLMCPPSACPAHVRLESRSAKNK